MPQTGDIATLISLLHENGDKVLNALSKLSLNATLLQKINKEFQLFLEGDRDNGTSKFQVLPSNDNTPQAIQDLHFLHDFLQKTIGLKLTNNANLPLSNNKVDVSKFKNIKYLEIKKVPVKEIIGLRVIQSQLESVVCIKCMSLLEDLLARCGGDNSSGFVWSELREAIISYNDIKAIDTSIAFAPWLEVLDLSHNQIVDVKALECLPNLKYINLSFNCLTAIPIFNKSARKKMQVLVLKNNYIEDLSGLAGLDYLTELDLSWNWISSYDSFNSMLTMSALQSLSMRGNPISYQRDYRKNVIGFLHISASFSGFILDSAKLSKYEKSFVSCELFQQCRSRNQTPAESVAGNPASTNASGEENKINDKVANVKKSGKMRLAVIPNLDDGTYEEIPTETNGVPLSASLITEHLITKKKIEATRAAYGSDNWLRCEAGAVVQNMLGLPPSEPLTSTPMDGRCLEAALKAAEFMSSTRTIVERSGSDNDDTVNSDTVKFESFDATPNEHPSAYFSVDDRSDERESSTEKSVEKIAESKETSPDIEPVRESSEEVEDENEKLYLVSKITKSNNAESQEELFIILTDSELKEKDSDSGRLINKWSISSLESCTKARANRLHLIFNSIKRDKRERLYEMEPSEARGLCKMLSEILESRTLHDMNQLVYKCVKCSTQFSTEINPRKRDDNSRCPVCGSKLIIEVDDVQPRSVAEKPADKKRSHQAKTVDVQGSHNRSSSAGIIHGLVGQAVNVIGKSSSQSSIGSAASSDELDELPVSQNTNVKRSDSDIEILSNPSQSSIEVIDGPTGGRAHGGNTPRRKRSSEERQVAKTPLIVPENLTQFANIGELTESSSSGSVTDSVCTAYESGNALHPATSKIENVEAVMEEAEVVMRAATDETCKATSKQTIESERDERRRKSRTAAKNESDQVSYSYTDFTKIDHRIKLLLYAKIFEDAGEDFDFILRCTVLMANSTESSQACIISSQKKLYILKVVGPEEGDDASNFLQNSASLRFEWSSVKSLRVLPWHQGFSVKLRYVPDKMSEFLVLLRDTKRTQRFLQFMRSSDSERAARCEIIAECSHKALLAMEQILISGASEDANVRYLSLFRTCSFLNYPDAKEVTPGAIMTSNTDLLLLSSEPLWFFDGNDQLPQLVCTQKMSSVMSVEIENSRVCIYFLNESECKDEVWDITMETSDGVQELVDSIKKPWEEMFLVPLQVSAL